MRSFLLVLACALLAREPASARSHRSTTPTALESASLAASTRDVPTVLVPIPNVDALRAEDRARETAGVPGPLRYGALVPVRVDSEEAGRWDAADGGRLVWRVRLEAPGAKSVGLEFGVYDLPEGGRVLVYDEGLDRVLGAYDRSHRTAAGTFVVEPFAGESAIVEYTVPADAASVGRLRIDRVVYDYRDVFELERTLEGFGTSGGGTPGCFVGANCPEGALHPEQRRATVRTLYAGGLCSASLVNNTAEDGTPYVLTAAHCQQGANTIFRFRYERPGCGSGAAPTVYNVAGATVLANHFESDSRLLLVNGTLPANFDAYLAGWDRSAIDPTACFSFNHPSGGPKAVQVDTNGAFKQNVAILGFPTPVDCWAADFHIGGIAPGSSGGPLFDQNGRAIGVMSGGSDLDCSIAKCGRFHAFWDATSIASYLDPLGTGALVLDGFDPASSSGGPVLDIASVTPSVRESVVVDGAPVTLTGIGFSSVTGVVVGGKTLSPTFPSDYTVVSDTELVITRWPLLPSLGPALVELSSAANTAGATVEIVAPPAPRLEVSASEPEFVFTSVPIDVAVGTSPGAFVISVVSPDLSPTVVPGIASLDIGANLTTAVVLDMRLAGAAGTTWSRYSASVLSPGDTLYWQAAVLDPVLEPALFPLLVSNVQKTVVLF